MQRPQCSDRGRSSDGFLRVHPRSAPSKAAGGMRASTATLGPEATLAGAAGRYELCRTWHEACGVANGGRPAGSDSCGVIRGGDGSTSDDACGVANGDNSTCSDQCGVPRGDGSTCADLCDACGVPNGDNATRADSCGVANRNGLTCADGWRWLDVLRCMRCCERRRLDMCGSMQRDLQRVWGVVCNF